MRNTEQPKPIEYQMRIYGYESGEAEFDRDLIHDSVVERHTLPFYRTIDDARLGMHEVILKAATQEATSFITYEIGDGGYPSIYAGTIDASRVEKSGIMFGNALDSFSLPQVIGVGLTTRRTLGNLATVIYPSKWSNIEKVTDQQYL